MRFERKARWGTFAWTPRKRAAAASHGARVQARQQARYPLIADQFAPPPPFDEDAEARIRTDAHRATEQLHRDFEARVWKESRRDARAATPEQQQAIRKHWQAWRGPATALYFRYVVDLHTGVLERRQQASRTRDRAIAQQVFGTGDAQGSLFGDGMPAAQRGDHDQTCTAVPLRP